MYNVNRTSTNWPESINTIVIGTTSDVQSTSLTLLARGSVNYGQSVARNVVQLLENFAGPTEPQNALEGQLWFNINPTDLNDLGVLRIRSRGDWRELAMRTIGSNEPATSQAKIGDLWYNSNTNRMLFFDGANWIPLTSSLNYYNQSSSPPTGRGDLWYDTDINQLKYSDGTSWFALSSASSDSESDNTSIIYDSTVSSPGVEVIINYVNGQILSIWSSQVIPVGNLVTNYSITIPGRPTATFNLQQLFPNGVGVGENFASYIASSGSLPGFTSNASRTNRVRSDLPFTIDNPSGLVIKQSSSNSAEDGRYLTRAITGTDNQITVVNGNGQNGNPTIGLANNVVLPGSAYVQIPSGTTGARPSVPSNGMLRYNTTTSRFEAYVSGTWQNITSDNTGSYLPLSGGTLTGNLTLSGSVQVRLPNGSASSPAISFANNTNMGIYRVGNNIMGLIVNGNERLRATNTGGQLTGAWSLGTGSTMQATYADVAERYHADRELVPGTVVKIGGECEITETTDDLDSDVFGVVSTNPAFMLNSDAGNDKTHPYVALAGRVPVRVVGVVKKGDRLVASNTPGVARAMNNNDKDCLLSIFGRALANKFDAGEGLVEAAVGVK